MIPTWLEARVMSDGKCKCISYDGHNGWLVGRRNNPIAMCKCLGASDAAVVEGISGFKTPEELRDELSGKVEPPDLTDNPNIKRGVASEPHIRALFAAEHPEYEVWDGTHTVFYSNEHPFMACSLDSVLLERETGRIGIHEIKSVQYSSKWKGDYAPDDYFMQVTHQMEVTQFDFAILHARIVGRHTSEKLFLWDREQLHPQGQVLITDEFRFMEAVKSGKCLPFKIPIC